MLSVVPFQLTDTFLEQYKSRQPAWGYGVVGWLTFLRTYARPKPDGGVEEWWETVKRVVEGCYAVQRYHCDLHKLPWNGQKAQHSAQIMYDLIFSFKFLPPGRGLWAMGTDYVWTRGAASLNNCAFHSTKDIKQDFAGPFLFLMDMSMVGVGVGLDTRGAGTCTIKHPTISASQPFVVDDSREGWVASVKALLDAFSGKGPLPGGFDYSKVRPAGTPLRGFGGVASGPGPLKECHDALLELFTGHIDKPVTARIIVDTANIVGRCVVAGGIRRTAENILGDPNDAEFLDLKNPALHAQELREWRWASNNSVLAEVGMDYSPFVERVMANGEPGFFWLDNAQHYRRMADPRGDWDTFALGCNPCFEQTLESGELCNLVETFPAHHDSYEEYQRTLKYAYLFAKAVSLIPTHNTNSNAIIGRNRRVGTSMSGITQAIAKFGFRQFMEMCNRGYNYLRHLDKIYSRWLCIPESIKLTSVKPSGTVSLLAGATPGIHFPKSQFYVRNIRFDPLSPLLEVLAKAGYAMEPSVAKDNTVVVSFPVEQPHFLKAESAISLWEQMELAAQMQHWWADNQVSITVTVRDRDAEDLSRCLSMYDTRLKSVSFLPEGKKHGFKQAPYIPITESEYREMSRKTKPIKGMAGAAVHEVTEKGCDGESCTI